MVTKIELVNKLRDPEKKIVLQAIEDLRARGWLSDGTLRGTPLCRAEFQDADLMGADLSSVDFHRASLEFANLSKADLRAAKFNRANLYRVNFDQADLIGADLYKANLREALNLTNEQLSTVRVLFGAVMPDGNVYDGRFNLQGDLGLAKWAKVDLNNPDEMANFYGVSTDQYLMGQKHGLKVSIES